MNSKGEIKELMDGQFEELQSLMGVPNILNQEEEALAEHIRKDRDGEIMVPIDPEDLTQKQKTEGEVSIHDHTSQLGKKLTNLRSIQRKMNGQ